MKHISVMVFLVACGGKTAVPDASMTPDSATAVPDAASVAFTLTSPTIVADGMIPVEHSCKGANTSPALNWTGALQAQGYAVVLTDLTNGLVHSVIWDIAGDATGLPANVAKVAEPTVPAGSKQTLGYDRQTRGYLGPCPPNQHRYQWKVYAVTERPLTGVTLNSTRDQLVTALAAKSSATATLTATFTP